MQGNGAQQHSHTPKRQQQGVSVVRKAEAVRAASVGITQQQASLIAMQKRRGGHARTEERESEQENGLRQPHRGEEANGLAEHHADDADAHHLEAGNRLAVGDRGLEHSRDPPTPSEQEGEQELSLPRR